MSEIEIESADDAEEEREALKLQLELLDSIHQRSIFVPSRTVFLSSDTSSLEGETGTDSKMAEYFMKNIHFLECISSEPITVVTNNIGGDVYHGLAIFDTIKNSSCRIKMLVRGHAMSMGSVILQAAHERIMAPNAVQMIHYGSIGCSAESKTFLKWAKEEERLLIWLEAMYLERIRQKRPEYKLEDVKKLLVHDTFLTAQASVDLGLADTIG